MSEGQTANDDIIASSVYLQNSGKMCVFIHNVFVAVLYAPVCQPVPDAGRQW